MLDLEKHRLLKYPLFSSLYFSQGIIYALATVIINVYLDSKGISDTIIGLITVVPKVKIYEGMNNHMERND